MAEEKTTKCGFVPVELKITDSFSSVGFCRPGSTHILVCDKNGVVVPWDCRTGKASSKSIDCEGPVHCLEMSVDGKSFFGVMEVDADEAFQGCIERWDIATGERMFYSDTYSGINQFVLSSDGKVMAFTDDYDTKTLDASTGRLIRSIGFETGASALCFSPDGEKLALGCRDGAVGVWTVKSGDKVWSYVPSGERAWVGSMCFDPSGSLLLIASETSVIGLDATDGSHVFSDRGHTDLVVSVTSSPDGSTFASCGCDSTMRIFSSEDRSCLAILRHPCTVLDVIYSPDSSRIVTSCKDDIVRVWDLKQLLPSVAGIGRKRGLMKRKPADDLENFTESLKKADLNK